MRIIVAGGKHEADYIIGMFKSERHQVIVINEDDEAAKYISKQHRVQLLLVILLSHIFLKILMP